MRPEIARKARVREHRVLDLDLSSWGGSALTGDGDVPKDRTLTEATSAVPPTYVPARNTIFLSLALGWAEVLGAGTIYIGAHTQDAGGTRTPARVPGGVRENECAGNPRGAGGSGPEDRGPLLRMSKAEVITLGRSLGVDFAVTSSCYDPGPGGNPADGAMRAGCARGLRRAGATDPREPGSELAHRRGVQNRNARTHPAGDIRTHWKKLRHTSRSMFGCAQGRPGRGRGVHDGH